jgi:hypothetical protein
MRERILDETIEELNFARGREWLLEKSVARQIVLN